MLRSYTILRKSLVSVSLLAALLLAPDVHMSPLAAQVVSATLVGTVSDASGASVPGAVVRVTGMSTGSVHTVTTTGAGTYNLPFLSPENYTVRIEAKGFKAFVRDNVELGVSTTVRVDAMLQTGDISETLTVTAESPLLQTEQADVGRTVTAKTIVELPLLNRDVHSLATTLPGVGPPSGGFPTGNDPAGTTNFSANGAAANSNLSIVDGSENREMVLAFTIYAPPPELVEEIRVSTNNYSAEFGHVGGAVVNVITRGGTNQFHGAAYDYNRVAALAARNFFNTVPSPKPGLVQNEFGGNFNGPVIKNKTFFLVSYQGIESVSSTYSVNTVPVSPWFTGNFSAVPGLALYDPATGNPNGSGRTPFANNTIPQSRISPVANMINQYMPQPNQAATAATLGYTNNYALNTAVPVNEKTISGRVDHNFSDKTRINGMVNRTLEGYRSDAVLGPVIGNGLQANNSTFTSIVNITESFTPTLLAEFRLNYARHNFNQTGIPTTLNNQKLGLGDPNPTNFSTNGIASFSISGIAAIGTPTNYPANYVTNNFSGSSAWNKISGKHTIKWGGLVTRYREEQIQPQGTNDGPRGLFAFTAGTTQLLNGPGLGTFGSEVNSFAAFLLGAPVEIGRTYLVTDPTNRQTEFAAYIQDAYQISRKFTLNIGVRYELFTVQKPRSPGGAGNYDYLTNTYLIAGLGAVPMGTGTRVSPYGFDPRVGGAYRLDSKSVLRGGFGMSRYQSASGGNGGTTSTQFPVVGNVQIGQPNTFPVAGPMTAIPGIPVIPVPANGVLNPAPDQPFYSVPFRLPPPYYMSYNLTYERELPGQLVGSAGYVGNLGRHGYAQESTPSASAPGTGTAGDPLLAEFGHSSTVSLRTNNINSNYNALQASLSKRFAHGLAFTVAYAFSKALAQAVTPDELNFGVNYGPTSNNYPNLLTITHQYALPFGKGQPFANKGGPLAFLASDWQINGIFRYVSGPTVNISNDATSCNCPGNTQVPNVVGSVQYLGGIGSASPWVSGSAFTLPTPGHFGNAGVGILHAPAQRTYNFSVFRTFDIKERLKLQYRAEFYNLTNTPTFGSPNGTFTSSAFGTITSASNSRTIQMALKLTF